VPGVRGAARLPEEEAPADAEAGIAAERTAVAAVRIGAVLVAQEGAEGIAAPNTAAVVAGNSRAGARIAAEAALAERAVARCARPVLERRILPGAVATALAAAIPARPA
jgi:hypothetical protein